MKAKTTLIGILFLLLAVSLIWWPYRQPEKPNRAPVMRRMWHAYDISAAETIQGEIITLEYVKDLKGMSFGLRMQVQTGHDKLSVILGPKAYVARQNVNLQKGDKIEVVCSRVIVDNLPVILAAEVRKGTQILKLRDSNGIPLWSQIKQ